MNNIYIIFSFINIFAIQIHSAPTTANVYDVVSANFSKTCPVLSNNVLVNSTTKYLSNCKDISLINPPEHITTLNINEFYCIGTLVADMQLCSSLSKYDYKYLPKSFEEFEQQINTVQRIKPADLCKYLKKLDLFNDTTIIPTLSKTVTELKEKLTGPHCENLCSVLLNEENSNELCSMMYFIHSHNQNITKAIIAQQKLTVANVKPVLPASGPAPAPSGFSAPNNNEHETTNGEQLPTGKEATTKKVVPQLPPVSNPEIPAVNPEEATNPENPPVEVPASANKVESVPPVIPAQEAKKTTQQPASSTTVPPPAEEPSGQPQAVESPPKAVESPPKAVESPPKAEKNPIDKGENLPNQTKTGDVTNDNSKETKTNLEQNLGPVFPDDKDYTTSTEINFPKQNSDTVDEYEEEDEESDLLNRNDDPNPVAEKVQEDSLNSRADINPSIKQVMDVDVEESNFFSYFMFISVMFIAGYVVYHNKQKIMALVLEGRRDRNSRRRPSTSSYRKLNSNLEEAVTSKCSGSASHVIY